MIASLLSIKARLDLYCALPASVLRSPDVSTDLRKTSWTFLLFFAFATSLQELTPFQYATSGAHLLPSMS